MLCGACGNRAFGWCNMSGSGRCIRLQAPHGKLRIAVCLGDSKVPDPAGIALCVIAGSSGAHELGGVGLATSFKWGACMRVSDRKGLHVSLA